MRKLFEMTVERYITEGLAVDASLIRADVHRQRSVPGEEGLPPEAAGRAVTEYLEVLDDAVFGGATPVTPKRINLTDPASRSTAATRGAAFYAYSTNYLIDLDHAVIVDVEARTSVRQAEVTAQRRMIERTQERFGLWPERLVADTAYGSAPNLAWLVESRGIEPHIPVFDKSARSYGTFERSIFTFDQEDDSHIWPGGNRLRPSNRNFRTPRPLALDTERPKNNPTSDFCNRIGWLADCPPLGSGYSGADISANNCEKAAMRPRGG
mgnify:CR=1 FL=1